MKERNDRSFTFRLPTRLLKDAHDKATERGEDLSEVIRQFLRRYTK